jgi:PAS domain S-box-containing protein
MLRLSAPARYGIAVASVGVAAVLRLLLGPSLEVFDQPFITFYPAVMVSAWFGGFGPGLLVTTASALIADYFWIPPIHSVFVGKSSDIAAMLLFVTIGAFISFLNEAWRRGGAKVIQSEEQIRTTLNSIGDAVIAIDGQGFVTRMNRVAETLTGWGARDARGRRIEEVFAIVDEPTGLSLDNPVRMVLRDGNTRSLANHIVLLAKDGRKIPIDDSAAPIRDSDGCLSGVVMVFRDTTSSRKAEADRLALLEGQSKARAEAEKTAAVLRRIAEERQTFVSLVEQSDDLIGMGGLDGKVIYINRAGCKLVGITPEDAPGTPIAEFHPEKWWIKLRDEIFPAVMSGEGNWVGESQLQSFRTGEPIDVLMNIFGVRHPVTGELVCYATVMRDITERKQIELEREELLQREKAMRLQAEAAGRMKDEFLTTISHELRTPLTAILGWAALLRSGSVDPANASRALEAVERNARAQAQLVEDLLDVSRIISGNLRLDVKPVNITQVVRAAVDSIRPAADAKDIQLYVSMSAPVDGVMGDEARLQQIVWNILCNGVKFTPRGGSIHVDVRRTEQMAQVTIADTGEGIRSEFLPYVFDRFQQADPSTTRRHGGLGLGLAIARHLVETHGGTIEVQSAGEGRGATFIVQLPIKDKPRTSAPQFDSRRSRPLRESAGPVPNVNLAGVKVLAIDDVDDTRELLREILEEQGADVRTARSAAEGYAVLAAWKPAVIVCDIGMPDEDGYSFIKNLRARPPEDGADTPAIALTGYVRVEDRMRALAAGYQMFVPKPIEPREFTATIASLLRRDNVA